MATNIINVPPLPPLRWDDFFWAGEVVLPSWSGFQSRRGPYGALSASDTSDGSAQLNVASMNGDSRAPPSPEEARAFGFLMQNESLVSRSVLEAVVAAYPKMRDSYGYAEEEAAQVMPLVKHPDQFRQLIGLSNVHVLNVANAGLS